MTKLKTEKEFCLEDVFGTPLEDVYLPIKLRCEEISVELVAVGPGRLLAQPKGETRVWYQECQPRKWRKISKHPTRLSEIESLPGAKMGQ